MTDYLVEMGYFVFSLDTELGWGYFDLDDSRRRMFSPDGSRERRSIQTLLDLLDEFEITATWALVGHLFYEKCALCETCPILDWQGKYDSFEQIYQTGEPLWYAADVVNLLLTRGARHEIAFHGYTHEIFNEKTMSAERAKLEIDEWLRVSRDKEVVPKAVVFPRDRVGHLSVFKDAGFLCYRSGGDIPWFHRKQYGGKLLKYIDHIFSISTPPVYSLEYQKTDTLINLKASQEFFGFNRRLELILDSFNLHTFRVRRMVKALKKAASERKILHICAHPWEFQTEKDFEKLRYLFSHVSQEIAKGSIQSISMSDLAGKIKGASL